MNNVFCHKRITNNEGSTLITVIVAIAFVTILTSIILGTSVMNFRMKAIDRRTKDDFYFAEKALNDIYTGIGQETAVIAGQEYDKAFRKVGTIDGSSDYSYSETAEKEFKKNFIKAVADKLKVSSPSDLKSLMGNYIVTVPGVESKVLKVGSPVYELYNGSTKLSDGTTDVTQATAERIRIKNVQVQSKDSQGFVAVISTDFIIATPTMDFLSASVDVTDYSIIANKGLYINGNATINGNIYAGLHAKDDPTLPSANYDNKYGAEKLFGGININGKSSGGSDVKMNGNYITSKGDINLSGNMPRLTVGNDAVGTSDANLPNMFFDTLRTVDGAVLDETKDVLHLNSNIYALNDLELNADNSKVIITGNYYGYNDKTLPDPSKKESGQTSFAFSAGHDDADSSAIIINGSHSTLDMSKIRSLVLMGRAYVDFSKGADSGVSTDNLTNVAATAEAVALKTNQQLYLVPTDLLESPNPVVWETEAEKTKGFVLAKDSLGNEKINKWFGADFVDITVDDETGKPILSKAFKTYKVTMSGGSPIVYYAYLNFNNKLWLPLKNTDTWKCSDCGTENSGSDKVCKKTGCDHPAPKYLEDKSGNVLGTGGSVSSMEAFFDIIMSSKKEHDDLVAAKIAGYKSEGKTDAEAKEKAKKDIEAYEAKYYGQPTPYASYERIITSMGYEYFDLRDCIIGKDTEGATIIYSQNSIVSYETEKDEHGNVKKDSDSKPIFDNKKRKNTVGMERYANYPQNLFHRYQWLATWLNSHQDLTLETDPNSDSRYSGLATSVKTEWIGDGSGYKKYVAATPSTNDAPPLSHYVALDKIIGKSVNTIGNVNDASNRGLQRNSYGDCIVKSGDLVIGQGKDIITVGNTFKGVAIADGNITVSAGTTVNGLLMATGVIILEDGATINYDKGLIQARIEKELSNVKQHPECEPDPDSPGEAYKNYYLITYLSEDRPTGNNSSLDSDSYRMYKAVAGSKKKIDRIEADYHDFMFYDNWRKGSAD